MAKSLSNSSGSNSELEIEKMHCDGGDNFSWQEYLEVTHSEEVPHLLFTHVEQSLQSGLQEGLMIEVPHKNDNSRYWIARIVMACGPLLRLRFLGQEDRSHDFWCDLTKVTVYPLGWCVDHSISLTPPDELMGKTDGIEALIAAAFQSGLSVPAELLCGDGVTAADRIKQGMKLEVQDKRNPHHLWVATIIENVGGRLLLRYDTPDSSSEDFWLFYSSRRLFRMGWVAEKGLPWRLERPSTVETHHGNAEWEAVLEMAKEDARRMPLPPDLFQPEIAPEPHEYWCVGMKLEAVHPVNRVDICPATVTTVLRGGHFLVEIDSYSPRGSACDVAWLCSSTHPYIFPVGWAQQHGLRLTYPRGWTTARHDFDWPDYITATMSFAAPRSKFRARKSATALGFQPGMKLEAVNPENRNKICAATIEKTVEHLLWIHLESNDNFHQSHIVSVGSLNIFPVGWCESNSYPLEPPRYYQTAIKPPPEDLSNRKSSVNSRSLWCPKIYFNHRCFSGPFLSKGKLSQLPKAVGPGPVRLVMREVLAMLISVAYKSSRVLKELQTEGPHVPGTHLEVLKAKYKTNCYRAAVAVVTLADQVPSFCKEVCNKLQVCPYLFGPTLIHEDTCPENCNTLSKTRFTQYWVPGKRKVGRPKGELSNMVPRPKKKRGRKKILVSSKSIADSQSKAVIEETIEDETVEEEQTDNVLVAVENQDSVSNTGGNDSDGSHDSHNLGPNSSVRKVPSATDTESTLRRKYRKREFPRSEIKTRGAKLPNFALQMRHWTRKKWNTDRPSELPTASCPSNSRAVPVEQKTPPERNTPDSRCTSPRSGLESNPMHWTEEDVYQYLMKTDDCKEVAQKCRDELIDGHAFMLLNLPTIQHNLSLRIGPALKLCQHIENVKLAFYLQYVNISEP